MRVALFEDRLATDNFSPIALLRPVFELLCGQFCARERALRFLPVTDWGAFLRSELVEVYQEENVDAHVNDLDWLRVAPTLFLNGRWLADPQSLAMCDPDSAGIIDGCVAYLTLSPEDVARLTEDDVDRVLMDIARDRRRVTAPGKTGTLSMGSNPSKPGPIERGFFGASFRAVDHPSTGAAGRHRRKSRTGLRRPVRQD